MRETQVRLLNRLVALLVLVALACGAVLAQDVVQPEVILEGTTVPAEITEQAAFGLYVFSAAAGDVYRAQVLGSDGFIPRLGIATAAGDVILRSDVPGAGISSDGSTAAIEWTIPQDGEFRVVVTAANEGETGEYRITLQRIRAADDPLDTSTRTVTFMCNGTEAITLAGVQLPAEEAPTSSRPLFIYTTDELTPVIRVQAPEAGIDVCWQNDDQGAGDVVTLPDGTSFTISEDTLSNTALFGISQASDVGPVTVTFGAVGPGTGQFMALLGGLAIDTPDDTDVALLRNGPRIAQDSPLAAYIIATGENNRLDPLLELGDESGTRLSLCDDAGGRNCTDVPPIRGAGVVISTGESYTGGRFDAGVLLPPGTTDWHTLTMASFGGNTRGAYVLLLVGERTGQQQSSGE